MVRPRSYRVLARSLPLIGILSVFAMVAAPAQAGTQPDARIALHVKAHTTKTASLCTTWSPNGEALPCSKYVTAGELKTPYDVYLIVVRGNQFSGIAGLSCGIEYQDVPGAGVDVCGWTLCADLEFTNAGSHGEWPRAGGGTRITWVRDTNCQRTVLGTDGVHAVAGAFYVYAYSADALTVTPNNNLDSGPELAVADCSAATDQLSVWSGGKAAFSAGAGVPGINPCGSTGGCELGPRSVQFNDRMAGAYQDSTIRIVNYGSTVVTGSVSVTGSQFSLRSGGGTFRLAPMEAFTVVVRFAPGAVGSFVGALELGVHCGAISLYGTGISQCAFEPRPLEFGPVIQGDTADRVVALRNNEARRITGTITLSGASFSLFQGGGAFALDPGDSLLVGVRFQPATLGAVSGTISAGTTCMALVLHGSGMPACTTSPNLFDFGKVEIGNSAEATFRIRNESARALSGTIASSDTAFVVIAGGGPVELPIGAGHTIVVRFQPDRGGSLSATIQTPVECQTIQVRGSAPMPPQRCRILPKATVDFGVLQVGSVKDTVLAIVNSGQVENTVRLVESQFRAPYSLPDGGGTFVLAPGDTLRARIRCAPTVKGSAEIWLDLGSPCEHVTLRSIAQLQPLACTVRPETMSFGSVRLGEHNDLGLLLTNSTGQVATGSIDEGCGDFQFLTGGGYWIESRRWANRIVRFQPTSLGPQTCLIYLTGQCADTVVATGIGVAADSTEAPVALYPMSSPAEQSQRFAYEVTVAGPVMITVFDVVGRAVAEFDEGSREQGHFAVVWNSDGRPGGIYFVRIRVGAHEIARRILLLR
jgi:hypothetical protein